MDKQSLIDYCISDKQRQIIEVYERLGSICGAARELDMDRSNCKKVIYSVKSRASAGGFAPSLPHHQKGLPGFTTARVSTLYGPEGDVKAEWHIQTKERESLQKLAEEFIEGLSDEMPKAKPQKLTAAQQKKLASDPDLMSGIFIGDAHVGQYSYGAETRQGDFDTDIATQQIRDGIDYLVSMAPASETGLMVDVGDALHADSAHNTTFKGTPVDVDTRYHRTLKALAMVMRYGVQRMLEKFPKVVVVVARGNHNDSSAIAIQLMLKMFYEREPRVTVLPTQGYFHYLQFGKWLIAVHHGDKVKGQDLPGILARDLPIAWGETTHRMWAVGHIHHQTVREFGGCIVRSFGTLAAPDGWHASQGYGSQRVMEMLTFKREGGLHSTHIYNIERDIVQPDVKL